MIGRTAHLTRSGAPTLERLAQQFREVPLLSVLEDSELQHLAGRAASRTYPAGATVFMQGEVGEEFFLIVQGSVRIMASTPDGREVTLAVLQQGNFFGDMALLDGEPRSASAYAATTCQVAVLHRPEFLKVVEGAASVRKLLAYLSQRLRAANDKIRDMAFLTVRQRLAAVLTDLAMREGQDDGDGVLLPATVNHRVLGGLLSTNRETVSREMAVLRGYGLIEQAGRRLRVLDAEGLHRLVDHRE